MKYKVYNLDLTTPFVVGDGVKFEDGKYAKQTSDIATVAYWYQTEPHAKFPQLPSVEALKNN